MVENDAKRFLSEIDIEKWTPASVSLRVSYVGVRVTNRQTLLFPMAGRAFGLASAGDIMLREITAVFDAESPHSAAFRHLSTAENVPTNLHTQ